VENSWVVLHSNPPFDNYSQRVDSGYRGGACRRPGQAPTLSTTRSPVRRASSLSRRREGMVRRRCSSACMLAAVRQTLHRPTLPARDLQAGRAHKQQIQSRQNATRARPAMPKTQTCKQKFVMLPLPVLTNDRVSTASTRRTTRRAARHEPRDRSPARDQ
jgi:hypothetical protein